MANLIITVISIALVAVAALMGAYYGGSAFMEGQAKANANSLVQGAEQIKGALTMYATNHSGSYNGALSGNTLAPLVPDYLSTIPTYSFADVSAGQTFKAGWVNSVGGLFDNPTSSMDNMEIIVRIIPLKVCRAVNVMAKGTTAEAAITYPNYWIGYDGNLAGLNELNPFACTSSGATYHFVYRIF